MSRKNVVVELTPFLYEDGNTYYFKIVKREYSNNFHDLYVYEKIITKTKTFFGKEKITEDLIKLNDSPEIVSINLDTYDIKNSIKKVLVSTRVQEVLKNWDGLVGNIPDDVKISLKRDGKLKSILGE